MGVTFIAIILIKIKDSITHTALHSLHLNQNPLKILKELNRRQINFSTPKELSIMKDHDYDCD